MSPTTVTAASAFASKGAPLNLRTALFALLALGALMLSVLAMHSAASAHVMGIPLPVSSSHAAEHALAAASTAHTGMNPAEHFASSAQATLNTGRLAATAHAVAADAQPAATAPAPVIDTAMVAMTLTTTATLITAASHDGMVDCALMVMGCVMLLVLATLLLSLRARCIERTRCAALRIRQAVFVVGSRIPRPSLTGLCISRI
ncbi:hypothetical protein [Cryobacterium sp. PH31-O1]|uniref:hypothetical protein n=1 Tax=Cryobacterium sp. PH31-O1 TaxID=3046306 RepID=UPI0024BB7A5E|nr:hypothetical protein [Cryobacterium sp. PH31-O1]MDJ0337636.1 hypothetical protein [Cryobacterium sp. PH31-O1]